MSLLVFAMSHSEEYAAVEIEIGISGESSVAGGGRVKICASKCTNRYKMNHFICLYAFPACLFVLTENFNNTNKN